MSLAVPLRVPFATLTQVASAELAGKTFEHDTPLGKLAVTVAGVRLYPSKQRLVAALAIDAKAPRKWLATKGTVYLSGVPAVDETGTKLLLKDTSFSRVLDNELWSLLSAVLDEQIRGALEASAQYSLAPKLEALKTELRSRLANADVTSGLVIRAEDLDLRLGRVGVAAEGLEVEGLAQATAFVRPR
jgi:hypothetical protein